MVRILTFVFGLGFQPCCVISTTSLGVGRVGRAIELKEVVFYLYQSSFSNLDVIISPALILEAHHTVHRREKTFTVTWDFVLSKLGFPGCEAIASPLYWWNIDLSPAWAL